VAGDDRADPDHRVTQEDPMSRRRTATVAVALIAALASTGATGVASAKRVKGFPVHAVQTTTTVVYVSAFPTGGKGSGTEATCALWSDRLQRDQAAVEDAPSGAPTYYAQEKLDEDKDNALDAGCVVID